MDEHELETISMQALGLDEASLASPSAEAETLRREIEEAVCALALAAAILRRPDPEVKDQLLARLRAEGPIAGWGGSFVSGEDACVLTDSGGLIEWVNPAFTEMCGYSLPELVGKKPGSLLQGAETDRKTARAMSEAVRHQTFCTQDILNYHKDGRAYWVSVSISPILGFDRKARGFIALERKLDRPVTAV